MRHELGGYIEFDQSSMLPIHEGCVELNSGRAGLEYLVRARRIQTLWLPDFLCNSVSDLCSRLGVHVKRYYINETLQPLLTFDIQKDEYLCLVDYYGQLSDVSIQEALIKSAGRLILDETQNLYKTPRKGIDTFYSVRKFLGVSDGGYLSTDARLKDSLPVDRSMDHMRHVLGRYENSAGSFFSESKCNNERFATESLKSMSSLTQNIIGSLDHDLIKEKRNRNYEYLAYTLGKTNKLKLKIKPDGPFAYPFYVENGTEIRKALAEKSIYVPTLWPNLLMDESIGQIARDYAENILPLPVDQRYCLQDMDRILYELRVLDVIPWELAGKKLAVLGGIRLSNEIVEAAKAMGVHTTVIDYNPLESSPAKQIADEHALISVSDTKSVAKYLKDNHIDGVLTGYTDSILGFYADICQQAGLPCYGTREQFGVFTDKKKWKALCRKYNVPTAKEYTTDILELPEKDIHFPLFIKPADSSGARGTSVAHNLDELKMCVEYAAQYSRTHDVVIEDYLDGPEITVFWLFINGRRYVSLVGNRLVKHNQPGYIPLPAGYTFPSSALPDYLEQVAPNMDTMLASQNIENGMMFLQCSVVNGIPYVYDIGYRLTGSLENRILSANAGYDPMKMLIHYAITGKMTELSQGDLERRIRAGLYSPSFNVSILMDTGSIDHFEGLGEIGSMSRVIGVVKAHIEGETLPPEAKGELRQIALRVLGVVDKPEELESTMLRIQDKAHVIASDGSDLKLPGLEVSDFQDNVYAACGIAGKYEW